MTGDPYAAEAYDDRPDWREFALCREVDTELFFPDGHGGDRNRGIRQAKAICAGCDVQRECLEWALAHGEAFGIWGGMTAHARKQLARRRAPRDLQAATRRQNIAKAREAQRAKRERKTA